MRGHIHPKNTAAHSLVKACLVIAAFKLTARVLTSNYELEGTGSPQGGLSNGNQSLTSDELAGNHMSDTVQIVT